MWVALFKSFNMARFLNGWNIVVDFSWPASRAIRPLICRLFEISWLNASACAGLEVKLPRSRQINVANPIFGGFSSVDGGFIKKRSDDFQSPLCKQCCANWDTEYVPTFAISPSLTHSIYCWITFLFSKALERL